MKPGGSSHKPEPDKLPFSTAPVSIRFKRQFSASTFVEREQAIARLKATEPVLRAEGVSALYLFGSHARGDANPHSDIDVFVDPYSTERFGFLPFMRVYQTIREALGSNVEIGYSTRDGLDDYIRADVEREAIRVF